MIIEIQGTNFVNRGSELMLRAITQHFENIPGDYKLAVNHKTGPYIKRARLGLYQKMTPSRLSFINTLTNLIISKKTKESFGLVLNNIDAVLDASGFRYSDEASRNSCKSMAGMCETLKKHETKIVLMPQAYGPFNTEESKAGFRTILAHSDLVFARDSVSYEHLIKLDSKTSNIRIAPDFTSSVKGVVPDYFKPNQNWACIIPNYRMIDKNTNKSSQEYMLFLQNSIKAAISNGLKPFILLFEKWDDKISNALAVSSEYQVEIIEESNPLFVKGIISGCNIVISSRYHGLINALVQNIPVIASGWSHKHQMLMDEYTCGDYMIDINAPFEIISRKVNEITEESTRKRFIEKLSETNMDNANKTTQMWEEVHKVLGIKPT